MEYVLLYTKDNNETVRSKVFKCKDLSELYSKVKKFCYLSTVYIIKLKQC